MYQVPQELIDRIIDEVASPSRDASPLEELKNCALTSRSLLARSQEHIFRRIRYTCGHSDIQVAERVRKLSEFLMILEHNPRIADYVRELDLQISDIDQSWIAHDRTFQEIMARISNSNQPLQVLTLRMAPHAVQSRLENPALLNNFFLPFIVDHIIILEIHSVYRIPLEVLERCSKLKVLKLSHTSLAKPKQRKLIEHPRPRPEVFECNDVGVALRKLSCPSSMRPSQAPFDFSALHSLVIHTESLFNLDAEQVVVDAAGDSLRELVLKFAPRGKSSFKLQAASREAPNLIVFYYLGPQTYCLPILDLRRACQLRRLETYAKFWGVNPMADETEENPIVAFCRVLSTIPTNNKLERLVFKCTLGYPRRPEEILEPVWAQIYLELSRIAGIKALELRLYLDYWELDTSDVGDSRRQRRLETARRCDSALDTLRRSYFSEESQQTRIRLRAQSMVYMAGDAR